MVTTSGDSSSSGSIPAHRQDAHPSLVLTIDTPTRKRVERTDSEQEALVKKDDESSIPQSFRPSLESTPLKFKTNTTSLPRDASSSDKPTFNYSVTGDNTLLSSDKNTENGAGLSPLIESSSLNLTIPFSQSKQGNSLELPSKDVESICTAHSDLGVRVDDKNGCSAAGSACFWNHPKVRDNWRVFLTAFGLLVVGSTLIVLGVLTAVFPEFGFQSYVFFISGLLCFIPGAYHVVYVYCAVSGRKGYDLYRLPYYH